MKDYNKIVLTRLIFPTPTLFLPFQENHMPYATMNLKETLLELGTSLGTGTLIDFIELYERLYIYIYFYIYIHVYIYICTYCETMEGLQGVQEFLALLGNHFFWNSAGPHMSQHFVWPGRIQHIIRERGWGGTAIE